MQYSTQYIPSFLRPLASFHTVGAMLAIGFLLAMLAVVPAQKGKAAAVEIVAAPGAYPLALEYGPAYVENEPAYIGETIHSFDLRITNNGNSPITLKAFYGGPSSQKALASPRIIDTYWDLDPELGGDLFPFDSITINPHEAGCFTGPKSLAALPQDRKCNHMVMIEAYNADIRPGLQAACDFRNTGVPNFNDIDTFCAYTLPCNKDGTGYMMLPNFAIEYQTTDRGIVTIQRQNFGDLRVRCNGFW